MCIRDRSTIIYGIDTNGIAAQIAEAMKLRHKEVLPVFIIADTFNRVVFVSVSYTHLDVYKRQGLSDECFMAGVRRYTYCCGVYDCQFADDDYNHRHSFRDATFQTCRFGVGTFRERYCRIITSYYPV